MITIQADSAEAQLIFQALDAAGIHIVSISPGGLHATTLTASQASITLVGSTWLNTNVFTLGAQGSPPPPPDAPDARVYWDGTNLQLMDSSGTITPLTVRVGVATLAAPAGKSAPAESAG